VVQAVESAQRDALADDTEGSMGGSSMSKRRGNRVVVGYVVSHTGKRGGPWEANRAVVWGVGTHDITFAKRWSKNGRSDAEESAAFVRRCSNPKPHARALPLVRYEVDAEEERLRDAVVEAADRWESEATPLYLVPSAAKELESAVRALRAHREKVSR
jgi:hypothetical protein